MKFSDVRKYVKGVLTNSFTNKTTLDKLSTSSNGTLLFNGNEIKGGGGGSGVAIQTSQPTGDEVLWIDPNEVLSANGKSAYEIAVDNGFVGTESQWLVSLKGEKGDKGDTGSAGSSTEIYATTETKVGTWLGKDLYRKTAQISYDSSKTWYTELQTNNIKNCRINPSGSYFILSDTVNIPLPSYGNNYTVWAQCRSTTGEVAIKISGNLPASPKVVITIEYTKS